MHYPLKLSQTMEVETFGEKQANPELSPLRDDQLSDFNDLFQFDDPQNEPPHKLASEGQSHTKQAPKPKQEDVLPTLAQIQRCMGLVAGLMPEMFPPKVVHLFYNKLMQKFADSPILVPETSKPDRSDSVKIENGFEHMPADQSVAVTQYSNELSQYNNSFLGHPKEKRQALTQAELQQRKLLRTVVAQSFCKGKGYEGAKTELSKRHLHSSFNSTIHDQILEQLLLNTQQYVQKLVTDGYCIKGARIVAAQVKSIQRVMAGCRYVLSPQICQIIFKAVEEYCSQGVILMSKEEGMRMLKGINQGLKKSPRVFTKPKSEITRQFEQKRRQRVNKEESESNAKKSKFELHRVWNSDFEDILLEMCRAGVQFVQIRQRFLQSYPNQKDLFTITALRSMFFKIIRMSVRRLLKEYQQKRDTLPHLCKMEDQLVKNIINCSQTAAIRRMLIEVYTSQTCGKRKLSEVIVMINRYAENGGALKKSVAISMNDDQE